MPGLAQAMVFKYSFQILPMANPSWCVLFFWESWFPSVFSWQLRRAVLQQMDNQGKRSVFLLWIHLAQRLKVGSSSPPNGSAAPVHGHQAWAFPHIRGIHVRDGGSTVGPCT